jgi:hypothetical protein
MSSEIARVIIERVLGEYLENIDSENIAVGVIKIFNIYSHVALVWKFKFRQCTSKSVCI